MDTQSEYVRARVTPDVKEAAEAIFSRLGLGHTEAIRLFYQQVILNRGLPFEVKIPNKKTRKVLQEVRARKGIRKTTLAALKREFSDADA
jgi:DNA-damage-inducible protein J